MRTNTAWAVIKALDFSPEFLAEEFVYNRKTGELRYKKNSKLAGSPSCYVGGVTVTHNGKTFSGARAAWILMTGAPVPVGKLVTCIDRRPGHYAQREDNLRLISFEDYFNEDGE